MGCTVFSLYKWWLLYTARCISCLPFIFFAARSFCALSVFINTHTHNQPRPFDMKNKTAFGSKVVRKFVHIYKWNGWNETTRECRMHGISKSVWFYLVVSMSPTFIANSCWKCDCILVLVISFCLRRNFTLNWALRVGQKVKDRCRSRKKEKEPKKERERARTQKSVAIVCIKSEVGKSIQKSHKHSNGWQIVETARQIIALW